MSEKLSAPFQAPLVELEIAACVVVADVLDHLSEQLTVVGQESALDVVAEKIAEDTTEILVTRIRDELSDVAFRTS